nr:MULTISPECIES: dihydrofolate reductase family protein [Frankia]
MSRSRDHEDGTADEGARRPEHLARRLRVDFLAATPEEALRLAVEAARGLDVRIGGGPTVVRDFLKAGLIDALHVAIAPILLGGGVRLWDELRGLEQNYAVRVETAESGTEHLTFTRSTGGAETPDAEPWRPVGNTL